MSSTPIESALKEWKESIGETNVVLRSSSNYIKYEDTSLGDKLREISAVLLPHTKEDVIALVKIAGLYKIKLYPISTGKNSGYGGASPVVDGCVVVDMSRMIKITSIEPRLGLITIEPGVTFKQLGAYLKSSKLPFLSPSIGADHSCSVLGNLLERGHGDSSPVDRFSSLAAIEVVLSDGKVLSSVSDKKNDAISGFYKWGVGPYLDGLFGQSNFGIVTNITISLTPIPESVECFTVIIDESFPVSEVVSEIRNLNQRLGAIMPFIKIYNSHRMFSRLLPYPEGEVNIENGVLSDFYISNSSKDLGINTWTVVGSLAGDYGLVKVGKKIIYRSLSKLGEVYFFNRKSIEISKSIIKSFPSFKKIINLPQLIPIFESVISNAYGNNTKPSSFPFWKQLSKLSVLDLEKIKKGYINFDNDFNSGIIFFSAVLPMIGENVDLFVEECLRVCKKNRIEPVMGLFNFTSTSIYVSLPILFDKSIKKEVLSAQLCYKELLPILNKAQGFIQRANIDQMQAVVERSDVHWQVVEKIKKALDPDSIFSPGRYS